MLHKNKACLCGKNITNNELKKSFQVKFKNTFNPRSDEQPLTFSFEVEPMSSNTGQRKNLGVLDPRMPHTEQLRIPFNLGCNNDCQADLAVTVDFSRYDHW